VSARGRNALLGGALAAAAAALAARRLSKQGRGAAADVRIVDPGPPVKVSADGPASSVQKAEIVVERDVLERIWSADSLELLARGYWVFLRRISLGIIRVHYAWDSRTVTALGAVPLLRFAAPIYETGEGSGRVTWPIDSGILVAREGRGRGHLRVSVARCDRDGVDDEADAKLDRVRLIAEVEVANFYPGLRGSGWFARFGAWFYAQTQLRIHVIVCNAYLRSLPRMDFPGVDRSVLPSQRPAELERAA
jgi:hypothetical protein